MSSDVPAYLTNLAGYLAGQTDLAPQVTTGITDGPGNQGTANTAHMMGQAGTAINQVPRALR
jgi:hypothetical protein